MNADLFYRNSKIKMLPAHQQQLRSIDEKAGKGGIKATASVIFQPLQIFLFIFEQYNKL